MLDVQENYEGGSKNKRLKFLLVWWKIV